MVEQMRYASRPGALRRAAALLAEGRMDALQQVRAVTAGLLPTSAVGSDATRMLGNIETLRTKALAGINACRLVIESCNQYLAIQSPSPAQVANQVNDLTRAVRLLAHQQLLQTKLSMELFEDISDT